MGVETRVMPATVYVAGDGSSPRWQFIVVFMNRSESEWTLTDCWLDGNFTGVGADSSRHSVPIDGNVVQGARRLSPGAACVLAIRDPYAPDKTPASMSVTFDLVSTDGTVIRDSLDVRLVPRTTLFLDFPLDGRWVAGNARPDLHGIGQAFAFDFVAEQDWPIHLNPGNKQLQAHEFASFGQPLYSPVDGLVVAAASGQPDLACTPGGPPTFQNGVPPGQARTTLLGNYVLIQGGDNSCVLLGHLKQESLLVKVGQRVSTGQPIGSVGNSGNTTGAHLHIEVLDDVPDLTCFGSLTFRQSGVPFGFRNVSGPAANGRREATRVPGKGETVERVGKRQPASAADG